MEKMSAGLLILTSLMSCQTVDLEKKQLETISARNTEIEQGSEITYVDESTPVQDSAEESRDVVTQIVIVKDPFFVQAAADGNPKLEGLPLVRRSMEEALVTPKNYIGGTQLYYYDENKQFPIVTKLLGFSIIQLEPGEEATGKPILSDTDRWEVAGDIWTRGGVDTQLIMIKPLESGLSTNMLVVTSKRIYQFLLTSNSTDYMPMVKFRYPGEAQFITSSQKREAARKTKEDKFNNEEFVTRNYTITTGLVPPPWCPTDVYDNGEKTYIVFPRGVLQRDFPTVFEENNHIVNYRVRENVMELDKLVRKATLNLGGKKVKILKKKGEPMRLEKMERAPVEIVKEKENPSTPVIAPVPAPQDMQKDNATSYRVSAETLPGPSWTPRELYEKNGVLYVVFADGTLNEDTPVIIDGEALPVKFTRRGNTIEIVKPANTLKIAYLGSVVVLEKQGTK